MIERNNSGFEYLANKKEKYDFDDLCLLAQLLRADGGCPWDREQTHKSIRKDIIEETYEVIEAIDNSDPELLREELGDVMFQVMFHSRIEEEEGHFTVEEVVHDICEKMIEKVTGGFSYDGLTGSGMTWNDKGEVNKEPAVCIIKDAKYVDVQ
jgi:tetrapyrrole methylase family protein/MazG family protein